jgi:integrase
MRCPGRSIALASLQHVYRRGHVFWWRRVHRLFGKSTLDVRLSLGTKDRLRARNRGAVLTAMSPGVVQMLDCKLRAEGTITELELQTIAKAMYEERLSEICTDQRSTPYHADIHSAANLAFVDYFERLTRLGGHMSFLPAEERELEAKGWEPQRIADLKTIIAMREERDVSPIRREEIIRHLTAAGLPVDDRSRWKVELALYPTYRNAYAEAEQQLQALLGRGQAALVAQTPAPAAGEPFVPADWLHLTPVEAAERMIAETPSLLDHRRDGKRAKESVGEQTLRQIRWAAALLQKSLPPGMPLWRITKADILRLDEKFDQLSTRYGKAPADRDLNQRLEEAVALAVEQVASNDLPPEEIGLSAGTSNKHYNKLAQVHAFMRKSVPAAEVIDFRAFTVALPKDEREARERYTREQGEAIFRLSPWIGCRGIDHRLEPGSTVIHDGLFYVLLLVWYTGARREELCKLMLDDVESRHGTDYLLIRPTETGRVKNMSARRLVVIADELIRLGFLGYVDAMRAAGERLLFPELLPAGDTKRKLGDVFYKLWWIYIAPQVPGLRRGQAMHAARHMVSDELKDQEVFLEFRNDHLGHKGAGGEGETRYPSRASLLKLKSVVEKIPVVTAHLPDQPAANLLPSRLRRPRPTRWRLDDN